MLMIVISQKTILEHNSFETLDHSNKSSFVTTNALVCFQVKTDLKLPAAMFSNPEDAAKNPEAVLDFVPGECWVRLLLMAADDEDDAAAFENLLKVLVSVAWYSILEHSFREGSLNIFYIVRQSNYLKKYLAQTI